MPKNLFRYFFPIVCLLLNASCTHKKKVLYFQGSLNNSVSNKNYNPTLKTDDLLSITVLGADVEAVKPFNLPIVNYNQNVGAYNQGNPTQSGYLIDPEGNIDFPVVGKIKINGLTRTQAVDTLKIKLKAYLNHPSIVLRIINYKVTVLGEVRNPGTFTIPNERITLPEALGIAGDLTIFARRQNISVIRDVDGVKTETFINLTNKDIFSSPVYYLQQNDLVYVSPNRAKINSSALNTQNAGLVISVISLLVTLAVLFTR
jgi:polysaccharide biosynthesis/export protein